MASSASRDTVISPCLPILVPFYDRRQHRKRGDSRLIGLSTVTLLSPTVPQVDVARAYRVWIEIGTRTELMADITAATGIPGPAFTSLRYYSVA
jgi:hypothetical protein